MEERADWGNATPIQLSYSFTAFPGEWSWVLTWHGYLRTLPHRTWRVLQRTCKQSLSGVALLFALAEAPTEAATISVTASYVRIMLNANGLSWTLARDWQTLGSLSN
jgi:hypothetical protein